MREHGFPHKEERIKSEPLKIFKKNNFKNPVNYIYFLKMETLTQWPV